MLKYIILFSFWQADEAIDIARKKGVFRYKAWGFQKNEALYLLENINKYKKTIETFFLQKVKKNSFSHPPIYNI